jgi:hypothetical protein
VQCLCALQANGIDLQATPATPIASARVELQISRGILSLLQIFRAVCVTHAGEV